MKAAVGELNLTVITVVAIAALAGLFYLTLWPGIRDNIIDKSGDPNQTLEIE